MQVDWEPLEFLTAERNGVPLLRGIDEIQTVLDDHISKTQAIRSSCSLRLLRLQFSLANLPMLVFQFILTYKVELKNLKRQHKVFLDHRVQIFKSAASDACEGRTEQSMAGCLCLLSGPFCKPFEEEVHAWEATLMYIQDFIDQVIALQRPTHVRETWMIIITESSNRFQCFGNFSRFSQQQKQAPKQQKQVLDGIGAYLCLRWYQAPAASGQLCDAVTAEWTNGIGLERCHLRSLETIGIDCLQCVKLKSFSGVWVICSHW